MPPKRARTGRPATTQNDSSRRTTRSAQSQLSPGLGVTSATNPGRSTRRRGVVSRQTTPTAERRGSPRPVGQPGVVTRGRQLFSKSPPARIDVVQDGLATMPTAIAPPGRKAMESVEEDPADNPSLTADKRGLGEGGTSEFAVASRMRICVFAHVSISITFCLSSRGRERFTWSGG